MSYRTIPGLTTRYALVSFDRSGTERGTENSEPMSAQVLSDLAAGRPSDLFLYSHGWKGDVPAAIDQYDRWIGAFERQNADRTRMLNLRPAFAAFHIGIHWPSQPWGDEDLEQNASFAAPTLDALVERFIQYLDDTAEVRSALRVILEEASMNAATPRLTVRARDAYLALDRSLGLGAAGVEGDSGTDRLSFDPQEAMNAANDDVDFGGIDLGGFLSPLRQLSFWTMKKRAQTVGSSGVHRLLKDLQTAAPQARIHLMGHSFGCIVMSAALAGPKGTGSLKRPVDSCVLVQGAMSLWAFSSEIPMRPGTRGYFAGVLEEKKVRGPVVTTRSVHDRAVRSLYPLAAGAADQIIYAAGLPEYGGIGCFGVQGVGNADDGPMMAADGEYDFRTGRVFNLDGADFIRNGGGLSGAHSDIAGPEVAHVLWQAALI